MTVPTAITVPAGKSTGSLQVMAVSPLRAAGLLLIMTVALPLMILLALSKIHAQDEERKQAGEEERK